jgi:hypothetical protein
VLNFCEEQVSELLRLFSTAAIAAAKRERHWPRPRPSTVLEVTSVTAVPQLESRLCGSIK